MTRQDSYLYDFEQFRLDAERQRLLRQGEPVVLPPKAIELLLLLVESDVLTKSCYSVFDFDVQAGRAKW